MDSVKKARKHFDRLNSLGYEIDRDLGDVVLFKRFNFEDNFAHVIFLYGRDYGGIWAYTKPFRDYLKANPEIAKRYEAVKLRKARYYGTFSKEYVWAKENFIYGILKSLYPEKIFKIPHETIDNALTLSGYSGFAITQYHAEMKTTKIKLPG